MVVRLSFVKAALTEIKVSTHLTVIPWTLYWNHPTSIAPWRERGRREEKREEGGGRREEGGKEGGGRRKREEGGKEGRRKRERKGRRKEKERREGPREGRRKGKYHFQP